MAVSVHDAYFFAFYLKDFLALSFELTSSQSMLPATAIVFDIFSSWSNTPMSTRSPVDYKSALLELFDQFRRQLAIFAG